ncbi:MAG TPA: hypothetical protein VH479_20190, partial [Acidimicrobiales bacterium]
ADQVVRYRELCESVDRIAAGCAEDGFHRLHHEDLVADTPATLAGLCGFLGVDAPDGYLAACDGVVFPSPRRTRDGAPWTPEDRAALDAVVAEIGWLGRYDFDG